MKREIDRIDTSPRFSEADAIRLNNLFRGADTQDMLRSVLRDKLAGPTTLVPIEGGPHAANMTHPAPVNDAILRFLSALD